MDFTMTHVRFGRSHLHPITQLTHTRRSDSTPDPDGVLKDVKCWTLGHPIDSGIDLSITIDTIRVFINKTLSTESLINQLLIKRVDLSISIDSR